MAQSTENCRQTKKDEAEMLRFVLIFIAAVTLAVVSAGSTFSIPSNYP
ncbi:hypothetical protein M3223_13570 [Paenibacillus pasadenensis]|nr:hypothetical protein [Paenibacillus pasadenensis]